MNTIGKELLMELCSAHITIRTALNVMTDTQQDAWARANVRDDVIGEGTTRAFEREAAIVKGTPRMLFEELRCAHQIIANAKAILRKGGKRSSLAANSLQSGDHADMRNDVLSRALTELKDSTTGSSRATGASVSDPVTARRIAAFRARRKLFPAPAVRGDCELCSAGRKCGACAQPAGTAATAKATA